MPHNPASIARLLYGELARGESRATALSLNVASNSSTPAPPVGQGDRRMPRMASVTSKPVSSYRAGTVVDLMGRSGGESFETSAYTPQPPHFASVRSIVDKSYSVSIHYTSD